MCDSLLCLLGMKSDSSRNGQFQFSNIPHHVTPLIFLNSSVCGKYQTIKEWKWRKLMNGDDNYNLWFMLMNPVTRSQDRWTFIDSKLHENYEFLKGWQGFNCVKPCLSWMVCFKNLIRCLYNCGFSIEIMTGMLNYLFYICNFLWGEFWEYSSASRKCLRWSWWWLQNSNEHSEQWTLQHGI